MKKLLFAIFMFLFAVCINAQPSLDSRDWVVVGATYNSSIMVDASSIERRGSSRHFWFLASVNDDVTVASVEFDCAKHRWRIWHKGDSGFWTSSRSNRLWNSVRLYVC